MKQPEFQIKDRENIPKYLYHMVPQSIFLKFTDNTGIYDCRNKIEWGINEDFIHTTSDIKTLREKIANPKWTTYDLSEKFILLKIETSKIESKITYAIYSNIKYYHIWSSLSKDSFITFEVKRSDDGTFILE